MSKITTVTQSPLWASPAELEKASEHWTDAQMMCRDMRHAWAPHTAYRDRSTETIDRTVQCPRCGTLRSDTISSTTGERTTSTRYTYPDGYLSDVGRIAGGARDLLRLIATNRVVDDVADIKAAARRAERKVKAEAAARARAEKGA